MISYSIPVNLENWIESQLNGLGTSLNHSSRLAQSIKRMADFYIEQPFSETPWNELWCQEAQYSYYFPINYLRNIRVFQELQNYNFFDTQFSWTEFGVGLGPSLEAFFQINLPHHLLTDTQLYEYSKLAKTNCENRIQSTYNFSTHWGSGIPSNLRPGSLLVMSYALTEIEVLPDWIWSADSIIIIEPSTQDDGRRLMELRKSAIEKNFQVIAPCTHMMSCPLLINSKKDWCHDRFAFERPTWMLKIESYLPFKNQTLTLSYLALKRHPSVKSSTDMVSKDIRVIGDFLNEKGKTRQLICRSSEREFLSFLKKIHNPPEYFRGDLLNIDNPILKKGDEIRVEPNQIKLNVRLK